MDVVFLSLAIRASALVNLPIWGSAFFTTSIGSSMLLGKCPVKDCRPKSNTNSSWLLPHILHLVIRLPFKLYYLSWSRHTDTKSSDSLIYLPTSYLNYKSFSFSAMSSSFSFWFKWLCLSNPMVKLSSTNLLYHLVNSLAFWQVGLIPQTRQRL